MVPKGAGGEAISVAMGYIMTVQKSLGYSPYYILFGRHPIFPAKIQECEREELPDLEDPEHSDYS